jgi:hypothetical protein
MNNLLSVTTDDGKYTVVMPEEGGLHALRYGERWRECVGDNLILTLAQNLEAARDRAVDLALKHVWREVAAAPPDVDVPVLFWHPEYGSPIAGVRTEDEYMDAYGDHMMFPEPTHWLPLPEVPK